MFGGSDLRRGSFDFRLRQFQTVPAPLCNALSDRPRDDLSVPGRKLVEGLPALFDGLVPGHRIKQQEEAV